MKNNIRAKLTGKLVQMCLLGIFLLLFTGTAFSHIVTNVPGYDGDQPFTLETGYVGVGPNNESQLFYYFVKSQRNPARDPLLLFLAGGPGCSGAAPFFYKSGPLNFNYWGYSGGLPSLYHNPYSWTKRLNIIYLDAPVGTGFSYSTTQENYYSDDTKSASQTYEFLKKWLMEHPQYLGNPLYIGGESYSGVPVPLILQNILDGNEAEDETSLNIQGYVLGNPKTDDFIDSNALVPSAHGLMLISDDLYQSAKANCNGDYVNINASNVECQLDINAIHELLLEINTMHVLEPYCQLGSPRNQTHYQARRSVEQDQVEDFLNPQDQQNSPAWCRNYEHVLCQIWANNKTVQEAIGVRENTKDFWMLCNITALAYNETYSSVVEYHKNFSTQTKLRALIYSGDHDLDIPPAATQNWIHLLNLTTDDYWRAWFVDGQVAGYTEKLILDTYTLVYATVKGAGHLAQEYKVKECYEMMDRFFGYYPL